MEPVVQVGILSRAEIVLMLRGTFLYGEETLTGEQILSFKGGKIYWNGNFYSELYWEPSELETDCFELCGVTIGIDFHWERRENQMFRGALRILVEKNALLLINRVPVEEYLTSVISSEMSATASLPLLKAHAVISRSWLFAQIEAHRTPRKENSSVMVNGEDEQIKWFDHEDHVLFDVCADDHCQRYQGITRAYTPQVEQAVRETYGEVLKYGTQLCDARFSKCCGGVLERFSTCWEDSDPPYLMGKRDWIDNSLCPDLTTEEGARNWIDSEPSAFCRVQTPEIISQVLNGYDQETPDFYRWQVTYSQTELSELIACRLGVDLGQILALVPLRRGTSGRISRLRIVGSKRTVIIGKELWIRRLLSRTHLYSSAFVVDRKEDDFILCGAGWGHGVGLCQIGAAVMGEQGYEYENILKHYYVGAIIEKMDYAR